MAKVDVLKCDCCHKEFRETPAAGKTILKIGGVGPVDMPDGRTFDRQWDDICPPCAQQLRDAIRKFIEARKGGLDTLLNDSTRSPKTEEIEKAVKEAEFRAQQAGAKGQAEERARIKRILDDRIAGYDSIITMREKDGDTDGVEATKQHKRVAWDIRNDIDAT